MIAAAWPPHFVVSNSQHAPLEQEAAFDVHFVEAAEVFAFIPAGHVADAHVFLDVQHVEQA